MIDGEPEAVLWAQEHAVVSILYVVLAQVDRAIFGVGVSHEFQNALQGPPELHGFRGRVRKRGVVHGIPRVVAE